VNWTFGVDWKGLGLEEKKREYSRRLRPGAILLLHDAGARRGEQTLALTRTLLEEARRRGLRPVRVDTLLGLAEEIERLRD